MFTFTINGEEYLPFDNSLYRVEGVITTVENLEEDQPYVYNETVGKFDLPTAEWKSFDAMFIPFDYPNQKTYFTPPESRSGQDFTEATKLIRLTPDQIVECPECGEWAGEKSDPDAPKCVHCGYGME